MNVSFGSADRRAGPTDSTSGRAASHFLQRRRNGRPSTADGESIAIVLSRWLSIAALVYATVWLGAIEPVVQYHVCLAVLSAIVIALFARAAQPTQGSAGVAGLLAIGCLWLLFTALQTAPLPAGVVRWLSPDLVELRQSYVPAVDSDTSPPHRTLSLAPVLTETAWPVYAIAFAFFWIGLATGNTRRGRSQLLAALAAGGTALAVWGMVQRARGSDAMLPGRPAPDAAVPFATLVYKNAGASLLIVALAAAVGLWLVALRPLLRQRRRQLQRASGGDAVPAPSPDRASGQRRRSRRHGMSGRSSGGEPSRGDPISAGGGRWWLDPPTAVAILAIGVIAAGLAASLSRGAWIAAALALIVWAGCCRRELPASLWTKFAAVLVVLVVISIGWFGIQDAVATRAAQMDLDVLSANDRITHWRDAAEALLQYPWVGAGLGTYGYAHLPHLDHDMPRWFHHAHSQPLEWAVETGAVGMVLLIAGAGWLIAMLVRLYRRRRHSSTPLVWFTVGSIAAIGVIVQSAADFVVLTPAVLWGYALVFGIVARVAAEVGAGDRERFTNTAGPPFRSGSAGDGSRRRQVQWPRVRLQLLRHVPAVAAVGAIGALLISQSWIHDRVIDQQLLDATRLPRSRTIAPSPEQIERNRDLLEDRLRDRPHQNELWQRLALWDVARYRSELMSEAHSTGISVEWIQTEPRLLFQSFCGLEPAVRQRRREAWLSAPEQRHAVARAREHFTRSLHSNPLVSQVHLQLVWLSPLTGVSYRPRADRCLALSRTHGEMQFELGWIARAEGDRRAMVQQWRRCLRYTPELFDSVFLAADGALTPQEFARGVLKEMRSNVWMALMRRSRREEEFAAYRPAFLEAARQQVAADDGLDEGQRHAYLATLCGYSGDDAGCLQHLHGAVGADPANPHYRYRYARRLLHAGRLREARDASTLGRALEPGADRFPKLLQQIDRQLTSTAATGSLHLTTLPGAAAER